MPMAELPLPEIRYSGRIKSDFEIGCDEIRNLRRFGGPFRENCYFPLGAVEEWYREEFLRTESRWGIDRRFPPLDIEAIQRHTALLMKYGRRMVEVLERREAEHIETVREWIEKLPASKDVHYKHISPGHSYIKGVPPKTNGN